MKFPLSMNVIQNWKTKQTSGAGSHSVEDAAFSGAQQQVSFSILNVN